MFAFSVFVLGLLTACYCCLNIYVLDVWVDFVLLLGYVNGWGLASCWDSF